MGKDVIKRVLREGDFDWTGNVESPLVIGEPKQPLKNPTNRVIVTVDWMSGDADNYSEESVSFNLDDTKDYGTFILFMKGLKWKQTDNYNNQGGDNWQYAVMWDVWEEQMLRKFTKDETETLRDMWSYDVFSDGDAAADPDTITFIYFDPSGVERNVSLDWGKINYNG